MLTGYAQFCVFHFGLRHPQEVDSPAIWLPGGVQVGWGVSEAREGFVTSLPGGSIEQPELCQPSQVW
jgi:hypothetical protein